MIFGYTCINCCPQTIHNLVMSGVSVSATQSSTYITNCSSKLHQENLGPVYNHSIIITEVKQLYLSNNRPQSLSGCSSVVHTPRSNVLILVFSFVLFSRETHQIFSVLLYSNLKQNRWNMRMFFEPKHCIINHYVRLYLGNQEYANIITYRTHQTVY